MKTLRFGIEIETVGLSRTKLAEAIHSVVGGTISNDYRDVRITTASGRTWKLVSDGPRRGGGDRRGAGGVARRRDAPHRTHGYTMSA